MKKKNTALKILSTVLVMGFLTTTASYAGQWKQEGAAWKYQNDNGNYASGWNWIDGKSYFFDSNGKMLANTTTPDGYTVNTDGAWVVNGVVQKQNTSAPAKANTDNYDPQYPLKGYMESWFVTSPVFSGRTAWKSDPDNYFYESNNHVQYALDLAISNKDPFSLISFGGRELAAIAKLTDYPTTGLEGYTPEEVESLAAEVRNFLNSFDWRNASDYEKAVRIAKRITQADYQDRDGTQYSYSCLVDGKANCDGYREAAYLLGTCVGLPVNSLGFISHVYPVFLVDGVWLAYEPTSKDGFFTVAKVYNPFYFSDGEPQLTRLGKFCEAAGYEVPTNVAGKFPDVRNAVIRGENAPVIYFK